MKCPIDGSHMASVFSAKLMGKHEVGYFQCPQCELLKTEPPYWLEEAYSNAIVDYDTGIMERNLHNALRISAVLKLLGLQRKRVVDLAGGYGILTRLLRDVGFDCWWSDKYCENIIGKGFSANSSAKAGALCAIEVMEHIEDPLSFITAAAKEYQSEVFIVSTETFEGLPPQNWWYYSRESGQHITFYSSRTMKQLATQMKWHYIALPRNLHVFTARPIKGMKRVILGSYLLYIYAFLSLVLMRKYTKTYKDSDDLKEMGTYAD